MEVCEGPHHAWAWKPATKRTAIGGFDEASVHHGGVGEIHSRIGPSTSSKATLQRAKPYCGEKGELGRRFTESLTSKPRVRESGHGKSASLDACANRIAQAKSVQ